MCMRRIQYNVARVNSGAHTREAYGMNFAVFVTGRMISVIPALWFTGWLLKRIKRIPDALIPFILSALGVIAGLIIDGPSANSAVQGLLAAAAAVMGHQAVKQGSQIIKGDSSENAGHAA